MTPDEAWKIVAKEFPTHRVRSCKDFGKFYGFFISPFYVKLSERYETGPYMTAVDKKTGKIFDYNILDDVEGYQNAAECTVTTLFDKYL